MSCPLPSTLFVFVSLLWLRLSAASGSARLIEPAMRSSLWRFNSLAPINFNDQSLDCGGSQIQTNLNNGRCGICGDPYNAARDNERGGKYDAGIVARRYRTGSIVTMVADLVSGNGGGYFEVKLCPRNNPKAKVTQACFDRYPLKITNGRKNRLKIPKNSRNPTGLYRLDVRLPKGVACTNCVIQWHYHAANEWGYNSNGRGCMGCGPQTEIYNCADVAIGYYGDPEAKAGPSPDLSTGPLADRIDIYANGKYATGVSPVVMNSGNSQGWASATDLTASRATEQDDDNLIPRFGQQTAGFVNLFNGNGNNNNNYDMYDNEGGDFGFNAMMRVMGTLERGMGGGGGGGAGGESGEGGNFNTAFSNRNQRMMRSFGGGGGGSSGGSSEEGGGMRYSQRNNAMFIPSITRQYRQQNVGNFRTTGGGSSDSSEERPRVTVDNRQRNFERLQDAIRDIANRQRLRKGLDDILKKIQDDNRNNPNDYNDYYYEEPNQPETTTDYPQDYIAKEVPPVYEEIDGNTQLPEYFKNKGGGTRGDGDSYYYTDGIVDGTGTDGAGGAEYYEYPTDAGTGGYVDNYNDNINNVNNVPIPEPEVTDGSSYSVPPGANNNEGAGGYTNNVNNYLDNSQVGNNNGQEYGGGYDNNNAGGIIDSYGGNTIPNKPLEQELPVGTGGDYPDYYGDMNEYYDQNGNKVDLENDFYDPGDYDYQNEREESMEEMMEENEDRGRISPPNRWRPPTLGNWPFNYQLGLMSPQYMNGLFGNSMNPALLNAAKQYGPWQMSNALSPLNPQNSIFGQPPRLSRTSPPYGQTPAGPNRLFSWMPSAQSVMSMGAAKSPIFSQKVANHYMSPFLSLSQSHPALRCQRPDQLVCVATSNYRNIPNADNICTTKCRAGGACGADYCSCACQKSLMCVHRSSHNAAGFGVTELDMWCTNQCNAGQCPNQVCACSVVF